MGRKTNVWIYQATKNQNLIREYLDIGKKETEFFLIAAQNNAMIINYIKARLDKTQQNSKRRLYGNQDETINNVNNISKLQAITYVIYRSKNTTKIFTCIKRSYAYRNPKNTKLVQVRNFYLPFWVQGFPTWGERDTISYYADCSYIVSSQLTDSTNARASRRPLFWHRPDQKSTTFL